MSVFSMAASNPALPTYPLQRSVRLRSSASAYFNRTPASAATLGTKFTWSAWVKRGALGTVQALLAADAGGGTSQVLYFETDNTLKFATGATNNRTSAAVFRDPSAWYHIVVVADSTTTGANRLILYVNNVQQTWTGTDPTINGIWFIGKQSTLQGIGFAVGSVASTYFDGYLEEINFIDGQALTPSSFGAYNSYGVWSPAKYTGTYGTNGFCLNFQDNSALTTTANIGIGADSSGNGNYWTSNNISLTAGVTYDSMLDVPTNTSPTNANYAVFNPIETNRGTITNGNLLFSTGASYAYGVGTILVPITGKWVFEVTFNTTPTTTNYNSCGVATLAFNRAGPFTTAGGYGVNDASSTFGQSFVQNGTRQGSITLPAGTIIQCLIDRDANTLTFTKNGTLQTGTGSTVTLPSGVELFAAVGEYGINANINFGQQPFSYTPPTGFNRLNTYNLPDSIVPVGAQYMAATTYTGTGAARSVANTVNGTSFQPDFVWIKDRSVSSAHALTNAVTGITKYLESNTTLAETTDTTSVTALSSTGFSLGAGTATYYTNRNGEAFVAWQWRASNASAVTNTSGTITSSVSANQTAGFSIVAYTGTGANATVGHGLGVAPRMVIIKGRATTFDWRVWFTGFPTGFDIQLNQSAAYSSAPTVYTSAPTSTVINIGTGSAVNQSSSTYVAYCFAAVPGYSAFGSYTGNGSADGPFVYLGFRPRWVLIKSSTVATNWYLLDSSRTTYNESKQYLYPNLSDAEYTDTYGVDFLSNGFKVRGPAGYGTNNSGQTYIYACFAENPFKNALAR